MHRIDGPGAAAGNLFTEGNPALGVPATTVTDDWANDVQEELVNVISDQGIALAKGTQDQLLTAIKSLISFGGDAQSTVDIVNNQAVATAVTGLIFDKTDIKAAHIAFNLERKTDSINEQETGWLYAFHDSADDSWRVSLQTQGDEGGVVFSITATGQIEYVSDELTGTNYEGKLRIGQVIKIKQ